MHAGEDSSSVWGLMIDALVRHINGAYGIKFSGKAHYAEIGRLMYARYPSIKREGVQPWVSTKSVNSPLKDC